jgi:hypothetical protein
VPTAWAAIPPSDLARLNRWAPTLADLDAYLPLVRDLLTDVAGKVLDGAELDAGSPPLRAPRAGGLAGELLAPLRAEAGRLVPLRSSVGALGLMQVSPHVWRGVYDVAGLRDDVAYNGRAGSEILLHYLEDHALAKREDRVPGGTDNLARAAYAAYNGGPRHLARYRTPTTPRRLRRIDAAFWEK